MDNTERAPRDGNPPQTTWGNRLESSFLIAALLTPVWMVGAMTVGGWPLDTTENISVFLTAALNTLINLSALTFLVHVIWLLIQAAWFWFRSTRPTS
jgi:hypothetical protein